MISIILYKPEHPGNIGAVARVMENFGVEQLILIDPQCNIHDQELTKRAKHASTVLKKLKVEKESCIKEFDYLVATTAQLGTDYNIPRSPLNPQQLAEKVTERLHHKKSNIGILFGPEGPGLNNQQIQNADFVVTIPSSKTYPTLNLSHAVAIILYELFLRSSKKKVADHILLATEKDKEQMKKMFTTLLSQLEFSTKEKKQTQEVVFSRIIGKSMLTKREAFAVMGLLRKLTK